MLLIECMVCLIQEDFGLCSLFLFMVQCRWQVKFSGFLILGWVLGFQNVMILLLVLFGVGIFISFMVFLFQLFFGLIQVFGCRLQWLFRFLQWENLWLCWSRLKFFGFFMLKVFIDRCFGLFSGCYSYLLLLVWICRLLELCSLGWKLCCLDGWLELNRYMLVSGVRFSLLILLWRNMWVWIFIIVFLFGCSMKWQVLVVCGELSRVQIISCLFCVFGCLIQNLWKCGNFLFEGSVVLIVRLCVDRLQIWFLLIMWKQFVLRKVVILFCLLVLLIGQSMWKLVQLRFLVVFLLNFRDLKLNLV